MKTLTVILSFVLFVGCAGIERINTKHKSDSQLKLRLSQVERELTTMRYGEGALHDVSMLESERDAIERELQQRYERGDRGAYLPQFGR
jgi:hypothetical protein